MADQHAQAVEAAKAYADCKNDCGHNACTVVRYVRSLSAPPSPHEQVAPIAPVAKGKYASVEEMVRDLSDDPESILRGMTEQAVTGGDGFDAESFVIRCYDAGYAAGRQAFDCAKLFDDRNKYVRELASKFAGRSDDGEKVTEEWLRSIGFKDMGPPGSFILLKEEFPKPRCLIQAVSDPEIDWIYQDGCDDSDSEGDGVSRVPRPKTRGDVRRLCAALGITEPAK